MGIWQSCSSAEPELRKSMTEAMKDYKTAPGYIFARVEFGLPPRGTLDTFSDEKASHLFERFARNRTWQVPTLVEEQSFDATLLRGCGLPNGPTFSECVFQSSAR